MSTHCANDVRRIIAVGNTNGRRNVGDAGCILNRAVDVFDRFKRGFTGTEPMTVTISNVWHGTLNIPGYVKYYNFYMAVRRKALRNGQIQHGSLRDSKAVSD